MPTWQDLRDQQLHFRQAAAQRPEIEKRLAAIHEKEQSNQAFLTDTDQNAASAWLIQRLNQAITDHAKDEKRCSSNGQQQYTGGEEELYKHVTVQARLRCDLEPLAAILYDLENGKPYLFVDQLMIYKQQTYQPPGSKVVSSPLDVRFNLTGYLRQPGKAPPAPRARSERPRRTTDDDGARRRVRLPAVCGAAAIRGRRPRLSLGALTIRRAHRRCRAARSTKSR